MELELFGGSVDTLHPANAVSDIVENIFPGLIYKTGYTFVAQDQFRVFITI